MTPRRVVAFIDGYNLYHAIHALKQNHLKWIDLRALCEVFAPRPQFEICGIFYFTAPAFFVSGTLCAAPRLYVQVGVYVQSPSKS